LYDGTPMSNIPPTGLAMPS